MTVEDLTKTLGATVAAVDKMGGQMSKVANEIAALKKDMTASTKSTTFTATGTHGKEDDKKNEKEASAAHEMITKMSQAIFKAAAEKDEDKRMAAVEEALGGGTIARKVASLEAAVKTQSHVIRTQTCLLYTSPSPRD